MDDIQFKSKKWVMQKNHYLKKCTGLHAKHKNKGS